MVQAVSYPPLPKTQEPALSGVEGTGHPQFRNGKEKREGWATPPLAIRLQWIDLENTMKKPPPRPIARRLPAPIDFTEPLRHP